MPVYAYRGFNAEGRNVSGILDAESARAARSKLRTTGIFPTSIQESAESEKQESRSVRSIFERIGPQDIAVMTRQLSTLVGAGLPLVEALSALIDQVERERLERVLSEVREQVNEGSSLADALAQHPRIFSNLFVNMVRAGEASGALDVVLLRLADYTESASRLRSRVRSALTYPAFMSFGGGVIMLFLMTYVVPRITRVFVETRQDLPLVTRLLLGLSGFLSTWWPAILVLLILAAFGVRAWIRTPRGRTTWDRWSLRAPVFGKLSQKVAVARFSRTLATLLQSGVPLLASLDIVKTIMNNQVLHDAIEDARKAIREGQSIAPPLRASGFFPPLLTHMIAVGEKSGELEEMLSRTADAYEDEVDTTVSTLTSLLEPIMILGMGGVVAFIVLAILLPIFQMSQAVS